jgi:hypothetical protein
MNEMKRTVTFYILLIIMGTGLSLSAQQVNNEVDLQTLYQQIDEAIAQSPQYVAKRATQITEARKKLRTESSHDKQFELAEQLYALYKPYKNDSALYYASLCISLADSLHRKDMKGLYLSLKAQQCSKAGMYVESLNLLKQVDNKALGPKELTEYYAAYMHVCGEVGFYTQLPEVRTHYYELQDCYRDSVLAVAEEGSEVFLHLKTDVLSARQQYQDALSINDNWLSKVTDGTHEYAFAAFYRSVVYEKLSNNLQQRYWLGKSALVDIECAVNDQASLFMLADLLCKDGDYERAYNYFHYCMACNTTFSPLLRNYQLRYVDSISSMLYQNHQARYSRLLTFACIGAILLLGVVVWLFFRKRKK